MIYHNLVDCIPKYEDVVFGILNTWYIGKKVYVVYWGPIMGEWTCNWYFTKKEAKDFLYLLTNEKRQAKLTTEKMINWFQISKNNKPNKECV